eukprot:GDKI01025946.1.p1 GENE.GDKI01025946.1~~GDKI01025946.1.p1  ORF type:complete len:571 (-),score=137.03 GDKI01025946.1:195-1868(-)
MQRRVHGEICFIVILSAFVPLHLPSFIKQMKLLPFSLVFPFVLLVSISPLQGISAQNNPFADPTCSEGILSADKLACCFKSCGKCDDAADCTKRKGARSACCASAVKNPAPARYCSEATAPCAMGEKPPADPTCATGKLSADGKYCCSKGCDRCDGSWQCGEIKGLRRDAFAEVCCTNTIRNGHKMCTDYAPPCIMGATNPPVEMGVPLQGTCKYCMTDPLRTDARIMGDAKPYLVEKMWPYRPNADQCCYRCQQRDDCGAWTWEDGYCIYYPRYKTYTISDSPSDRTFRRVAGIRKETAYCNNSDPTCRTGVRSQGNTACCKKGCTVCKVKDCTATDVKNGCCATDKGAQQKCMYNMPPCQMEPSRDVDKIGNSCWLRISALGQVPNTQNATRLHYGSITGKTTTEKHNKCVTMCDGKANCTTAHFKTNTCTLFSGSKGGQDPSETPIARVFNQTAFEDKNGATWVRSVCKGCCTWSGENFSGQQKCWAENVEYFGPWNNQQNSLHTAGSCTGDIWTKQKHGGEGGLVLTYWPGMTYKNMSPPWKEETSSMSCACV